MRCVVMRVRPERSKAVASASALWGQLARAPKAVSGLASTPGCAEPPRAARCALGRRRSQAKALPRRALVTPLPGMATPSAPCVSDEDEESISREALLLSATCTLRASPVASTCPHRAHRRYITVTLPSHYRHITVTLPAASRASPRPPAPPCPPAPRTARGSGRPSWRRCAARRAR